MSKAIALATAIFAVTGLAQASPTLARTRTPTPPPGRNIICEPPPPTSNVVTSKQGGIALQLPGFGVSGDRQRFASKTDVIISVEGSLGHMALTMLAWACHTAVTKWPNDPEKQLEFMLPYLDRLQGTVAAAAGVGAELAASGRGPAQLAQSPPAMAPAAPAAAPPGAQARLEPFQASNPGDTREAQGADGVKASGLFDLSAIDRTPDVKAGKPAQPAQAVPRPPKQQAAAAPAPDPDALASNGCFGNACQGWGNGFDQQMAQTRSYAAPTINTTMSSTSSCVSSTMNPFIGSSIAISVGNGMMLLGSPPVTTTNVIGC